MGEKKLGFCSVMRPNMVILCCVSISWHPGRLVCANEEGVVQVVRGKGLLLVVCGKWYDDQSSILRELRFYACSPTRG